jgi:hypothetical protein
MRISAAAAVLKVEKSAQHILQGALTGPLRVRTKGPGTAITIFNSRLQCAVSISTSRLKCSKVPYSAFYAARRQDIVGI